MRGNAVTRVGQPDEDTVALFDQGRYVSVPREVLVEQNAKVPHSGALRHCLLSEPDRDRRQRTAILSRTKNDQFSFAGIHFEAMIVKPVIERVQSLFKGRDKHRK